MLLSSWLDCLRNVFSRSSAKHRPGRLRLACRLHVEPLEDRLCPSGGYLLVDSFNTNSVLRYDEQTGAFVDEFVKKNSGGLFSGANMDLGPDHNLYVSNGLFSQNNKANDVLRFDGATGAFLGDFTDSGQLTDPRGIIFGRDGNLYVADGDGPGQVQRYNGQTGAFLDTFVSLASGGLSHPSGMLFGSDGNLYVIATDQSEVLRFQGPTGKHPGAFIDTFVTSGSGGLHIPLALTFGPDGNLYVANSQANNSTPGGILRYNGKTGAFIDTFVAPGSGGLIKPLSVVFGAGGDLFVGSSDATGGSVASPHTSTVLRYDGITGAFLGTFVTPDSGGLRYPSQLLFTVTDPVTLVYRPSDRQVTGLDTSKLGNLQIQITNLGGQMLGLPSGHIIWLDANAGRGWFVDQPVTMSYRTTDATATTSDNDYVAKTGTLTFNPGETTKTITIVVNGDSKKEANETLFLDLFGNGSNALLTKSRGIGTILRGRTP